MVEIGGHPMLWHIMNIYAHHGFQDFIVALGYKGDVIKDYFLNFRTRNSDLRIDLATGQVKVHRGSDLPWSVDLLDTGLSTQTGGRLKRLAHWLDEDVFMLTYGDGVANVDLRTLLEFHRGHGKLATVTAVRPPARFGGLALEGDAVLRFTEKPQAGDGWINGGFFVLDRRVLDFIDGDATLWEREPLERLAEQEQLRAFRHEGFWQPMDTIRERNLLEELWTSGKAPWKVWA
jgi:glucose-1-phosphate cytidylyltransferase